MSRAVLWASLLLAFATLVPQTVAFSLPSGPATGLGDAPHASPSVLEMASSDDTTLSMADDDEAYGIQFVCPERTDKPAQIEALCPTHIQDVEDIFGSPVMLIDPVQPAYIGFSAMHGGRGVHVTPGDEPPTERSRYNALHQPHTTFRTVDGGASWNDHPYHAPDSLQTRDASGASSRDIYGEDNAATLDGSGRLYLAAAYSHREKASGSAGLPDGVGAPWRYSVGLWKQKGLEREPAYDVNSIVLHSGGDGASLLADLDVVYVPATNVVAAVWREEAPEGVDLPGTENPVIVHYTRPQDGALWKKVDVNDSVGPCAEISNALVEGARILVACRTASGSGDATNETGIGLHAIDTTTWKATRIATLPFTEGHILLIERTGYEFVVAIASGVASDGSAFVRLAYGEHGEAWSGAEDIGSALTKVTEGAPLIAARVTAAAYAPVSGNIHLIYTERYDVGGASPDNTPGIYKVFAAVQAEGTFQGKKELEVGQETRAAFSPTLAGAGDGVFADLHDSIVVWQHPAGRGDREFVAFGDYGFVRFAEVVEENFIPPIPPMPVSTAAIPLATAGSVPATVGIGAGLLAGAMVARTLAARRKLAVEAGAE